MEISADRFPTSGRALLLPALGFCVALCSQGCSSAAAPLTITMQHPETKQTLTCAAKDQFTRADTSVLASAVESCAKGLEARGFVRQR